MRRKTIMLAAAMAFAPVAFAGAQVCTGSLDLANAPMQVGADLGIHDGANSYVGSFGMSTRSNWFGALGIGTVSYEGDESSTLFGVRAGRQLAGLSFAKGKVKACPTGSFTYESGPSVGDIDFSSNQLKLGLAVGGELSNSPQISVRPTGTASLARLAYSVESPFGDESDSEIGLMLDLGVGFVFNRNISLIPSLSLPVGFDGAEESLNIAVAFGFGRR